MNRKKLLKAVFALLGAAALVGLAAFAQINQAFATEVAWDFDPVLDIRYCTATVTTDCAESFEIGLHDTAGAFVVRKTVPVGAPGAVSAYSLPLTGLAPIPIGQNLIGFRTVGRDKTGAVVRSVVATASYLRVLPMPRNPRLQ